MASDAGKKGFSNLSSKARAAFERNREKIVAKAKGKKKGKKPAMRDQQETLGQSSGFHPTPKMMHGMQG